MRLAIASVACAGLAACALAPPATEPLPLAPGEIRSAHAASQRLTLGKSTKAEVRAALGEATVIGFASGYEVWIYNEPLPEKAPPPPTELVLLFAPSGLLDKARIR